MRASRDTFLLQLRHLGLSPSHMAEVVDVSVVVTWLAVQVEGD